MRRTARTTVIAAALAGLALLLAALPGQTDTTPPKPSRPPAPSPLRLIPAEADFFLHVPDPGQLAAVVQGLDVLEKALTFPIVKEQLDATGPRRARQLLAHFEKTLGAKWPDLLARLGGGGAALGAKFGDNAPALLVVQGTDVALAKKAFAEVVEVLDGELARQESKDRPVRLEVPVAVGEGVRVGDGFFLVRAGAAMLLSNKKGVIEFATLAATGKGGKTVADLPGVAEAARVLPPDPLARLWINMKPVHDSPQGKALYASPRDDVILTSFFGTYLDVLGRSPFVTAGLHRTADGFLATVRMPRGRAGAGPDAALFLPPVGQPGTLAPLAPRGLLYADSFYYDLGRIWTDREKLFPKTVADGLVDADRRSAPVLVGAKLSELLTLAGARHRIVAVDQPRLGYKKTTKQPVPAFAFIPRPSDAEKFAAKIEPVVRAGALLAASQVKLKLVEETHRGVSVVGYRFDEKAELPGDVNDVRWNFSPCFCRVGDDVVFCSTLEFCRELIELLQAEQKAKPAGQPERYTARIPATGVAALLTAAEEALVTQAILDQAVPPGEAREQVKQFIALVRGLGTLRIDARATDDQTHFEFRTGK